MRKAARVDDITDLIIEVFRLNGCLLAAGDELVRPIGLTSARWQVLGAIDIAGEPRTVAQLARDMGLTRQSVQRTVNELEADAILEFRDNPSHKRARLLALSAAGARLVAAASDLQTPWARALTDGISPADIGAAARTLKTLRRRLEHKQGDSE